MSETELDRLSHRLPFAFGGPSLKGDIRVSADDFFVDEDLGFEPDGEGHHVLLLIEKRNTNTQWLAKQLARYVQLPLMEVGYAGLKDRHAVTRQWFSVHLAGRDVDWDAFNSDEWRILQVVRHQRKLRPGFLRGNKFRLIVRNLDGDFDSLAEKLSLIEQQGFPNYFGEQRFGHDNLSRAQAWLAGEIKIKKKQEKSILLSSLRSAIFNQVLACRVERNSWNQVLLGDVMMLAGTHSVFVVDELDETIKQRVIEHDVTPTGTLYGEGESGVHSDADLIEANISNQFPEICHKLKNARLKAQRRPLVVYPESLQWEIDKEAQTLCLSFSLTAGSYATSLLGELVKLR